MENEYLKSLIAKIPDFPKKGILFYDLTPIFADGGAFTDLILQMQKMIEEKQFDFNKIVGIEARGFIIGSAIALAFEVGFVPIRRCGKLPRIVHKIAHDIEYSRECHEIHQNDITEKDKILIVDDILATGGSAKAASELITECGGIISGYAFVANIPEIFKGSPLDFPEKVACLMELP